LEITPDDLKLIVRKFGIKPYGLTGDPSWLSFSYKIENLDLMGWLRKEVSGAFLTQLQQKFATAGLTI
jgi:hypothetical protein